MKTKLLFLFAILVGAHCPDFIGMPVQNGNEIEIDLEYLTSGVYFVVVDFAGKRGVVKILKNLIFFFIKTFRHGF